MTNIQTNLTKKDYAFSLASGLIIGLLCLPVLKAAKPELYSKIAIGVVPFFFIATFLGLVIAFYISKKITIIWQIAKFGVIGVLNTLVDLGSLALITFIFRSYLNIDSKETAFAAGIMIITFYSVYKATTFIIANVNSYYWNKYWTFDQGGQKKTRAQFFQFFLVSIIGFIINVLVASVIFKMIGATGFSIDQVGLIGAAAGSIMGMAWNFIGYKFMVFKEQTA
jgi:putative flippase GtrA